MQLRYIMKLNKTIVCGLLVSSFSILVSGCKTQGKKQESNPEEPAIPEVCDDLAILDGVGFDYDHAFFDDFTNGVNYDNWIISEDCWGSNKG